MSVYLDASVLVSTFINDDFSARASLFLGRQQADLIVSDFAKVEFASAVAKRIRVGASTRDEARAAFSAFDVWAARFALRLETEPSDLLAAEAFLRRLDLNLRTGDALNIAVAQRAGAGLATFDDGMARCAAALGVALVEV